ncbi:L10-interacting MYB domain-containing protein-like [Gossypium hirsutum]|uniref:L10-interacting MYB domain-containing protein-like n=1 Tax=Gossypium hirsutum TaxID=3635 RepID=A0ABM3ACM1_GOSHI|nr:L10-interacting MYB domain-containing protein-like [Gossypium hirsutum]XP_040952556.1 L10-interacting MYB domain-containing protein-like [Gossypium hirsutum]
MVKTRNFVEGDSTLATKVVWDDELTLIFCELCVNEVNAGNRPTTHLNSKGWENVVALFQAKTQKIYRKPQLKNKWDTLKKEWRLWRELLKESTGIGWCPSKKTVDATEEWWDAKIQPLERTHGHLRLVFFQVGFLWEMMHLMKDLVIQINIATRMKVFLLMRYHQNFLMKSLIEESKHLGLYTVKEKKSSSSRKSSRNTLTTQIEKLCERMAIPRKSVNEIIFPHSQYTISNAMDALRALGDEIPKKDELYYFATKMFQIPVKREVFLNLDPDDRVWWLRCEYAEQNPIASFSSLVATSSFPFQPYHQPPLP